jgi:uncharacterized protein
MEKKKKSRWLKWLRIAALIYVACGVALFFLQEKFLFHPEPLPQDHVFRFNQPFTEIYLPVNNEKNLSIVKFTVPDSVRKGIVLYFHGNRNNIERYAAGAAQFTRNNYEVWMMDYPGYGKSTGERTEHILYADALILYNMARSVVSSDSIILYGRSLGTGIAAQLASVRESKRLILESPYYSMNALAARFAFIYPVKWMMNFHFPTHQYLAKIDEPVTIIHGTSDLTIPFRQAKRLMKIAPKGTELIAIEGGHHNDLAEFPLFQEKIDSLLK